ncbi:SDR family NAD(P)-dependent oxidoreductase, partial [Stenotrophomonas maltophilia]|uniref:SDR family NAD(P)-dependent oxidoreductase n=1 Tax=Stenotrophomonas maltophilia TaxID=40324 RepID=UPI0013DD69DA
AVTYAREGAKVISVDMAEAAAEETAGIIRGEGGEAIAVTADTTNLAAVEAAVQAAIARFGTLDILHNNVGV